MAEIMKNEIELDWPLWSNSFEILPALYCLKGCPIDRDSFRSRVWAKVLKDVDVRYRPLGKTRSTAVSHSLAGGANYIAVAKALLGIVSW
jgi:hypothetical protein